jgi:hypothetical protein
VKNHTVPGLHLHPLEGYRNTFRSVPNVIFLHAPEFSG